MTENSIRTFVFADRQLRLWQQVELRVYHRKLTITVKREIYVYKRNLKIIMCHRGGKNPDPTVTRTQGLSFTASTLPTELPSHMVVH